VYWQVSARLCGNFSPAQRYRLQATNVSAKKTAMAIITKIAAKTLPQVLVSKRQDAGWLRTMKVLRLIEVSL
jgi:hypothetical protein